MYARERVTSSFCSRHHGTDGKPVAAIHVVRRDLCGKGFEELALARIRGPGIGTQVGACKIAGDARIVLKPTVITKDNYQPLDGVTGEGA
ncbi:hypothetical protein [Bradyrhizobium sp. RT4b]|uniref:hypothetical protein n=1 Tax=Bradyrhizobium sp. RT4b TaxID=3156379 RepID=UPI003393255B